MKKRVLIGILVGCIMVLQHCTNELPMSDLINNTITLKLLGTYESNNPYGFGNFDHTQPTAASVSPAALPKDDVITATAITNASPTLTAVPLDIVNYANGVKPSDIKYYIDIAEIRLAQGLGKSSSQSISDYWSQFAIQRQLMCSDYSTADTRILSNCADQNGIQRLSDFFNGGMIYPAVDVKSGFFNHMGIYFRRFATYPAALFESTGAYFGGTATTAQNAMVTTFDNRTIYGLDVESLLQNQYGVTSAEPLMFPLQRKDLALHIFTDNEPYVLEVRIFLKNLMMVHVLQGTRSVTNGSIIYVAPADWNIDHAFKESVNGEYQGGSVLMTARTYQPAKVGAIQMTSVGTAGHYFAVMPAGTAFVSPVTVLPHAATAATNTLITNLSPGRYDVYRTCDNARCINSSTAGTCSATDTTADGYPETAKKCDTVTVTSGTTTSATTCACP
jgi:hypothetical protein